MKSFARIAIAIVSLSNWSLQVGAQATPPKVPTQTVHESTLPRDANDFASTILAKIDSEKFNGQSCKSTLASINTEIFKIKPGHFENAESILGKDGTDAVNTIFKSRAMLGQKLRQMISERHFHNMKSTDETADLSRGNLEGCVEEMRRAHRNLRSMEDLIGLISLRHQNKLRKLPVTVGMPSADLGLNPFTDNQWPNLLVNTELVNGKSFDRSSLRSGDIFMTKGTTFASAVISRIGKVDNQFSHLAIVYQDDGELFGPKNVGEMYVVESEPDFGLQIVSLDHFMRNDKNRLVLYRYNPIGDNSKYTAGEEVAKRAAKYVARLAGVRDNPFNPLDKTRADRLATLAAKNQTIKQIGYGFGMDMKIESELFCSQVISFAFQKVCDDKNLGLKCQVLSDLGNKKEQIIPLVQSKIVIKNNDFAELLALSASETFAPADAEVEPRFELIAEWRDYAFASYTRMQDLATTKLFQLMEEGSYKFQESAELEAFAQFATKKLKDAEKMPGNMPDGLTKGSLYTAFLTWFSGPGNLITDIIEKMDSSQIVKIADIAIKSDVLTKETITKIFSLYSDKKENFQDATREELEKMKSFIVRMVKHKSLLAFIQELESDEEVGTLKTRGLYITERTMSDMIDRMRIADCQLYKEKNNIPLSEKKLDSKRTTLFLHDLVRANGTGSGVCSEKMMPLGQF